MVRTTFRTIRLGLIAAFMAAAREVETLLREVDPETAEQVLLGPGHPEIDPS